MLKKVLFTSILCCSSIATFSQTDYRNNSNRQTITDKSIVYPEDMERNYDLLLSEWDKNLKYSSNCNTSSIESPTVSDKVYTDRLYSLPTRMELAFNPIVRNYIEMYAGRRRNQVSYMLEKGKYYFPIFEMALDREGVPLELKYLPVIESALNATARSRAGAMGLWQFMAPTGRMYNLEVNSLVDERCDPEKSSRAAAKYLKDMYNIYGDWNLVIAAYNCGPGNVNKAIRRSGGQRDYWAIYPHLPKETRGYVPAFIAATYIMSYHQEHNICPAVIDRPSAVDTLQITNHIHFEQISNVLNIPIDDIRTYNPEFKEDIIPGEYKSYTLRLPINKVTEFIDKKQDILSYKPQAYLTHRREAGPDEISGKSKKGNASNTIRHKVKKGETLAGIAKKYGVTLSQLKSWNGLKSNNVPVKRTLSIYKETPATRKEAQANVELASKSNTQSSPEVSTSSNEKDSKSSTITYYKIRKGDNWNTIAKKNGVTITELKKWNNLYSSKLVVGKNLKIVRETIEEKNEPQLAENKTSSSVQESTEGQNSDNQNTRKEIISSTSYYKIKKGDNWSTVAKKNGVTIAELKKWNNNPKNLIAGKQLKIVKEKIVEVPIEPEVTETKIADPELAQIEMSSEYITDVLEDYLEKVENKNESLPVIRIGSDNSDDRVSKGISDQTKTIYHKVKIGETLTQIATKYNVSKKDIQTWNKMPTSKARVGQRLLIRLPEEANADFNQSKPDKKEITSTH